MNQPNNIDKIIDEECGNGWYTQDQKLAAIQRLEEEMDMHPQQARKIVEESLNG